jgi:tetratricopeptide (TPR) repeat protein
LILRKNLFTVQMIMDHRGLKTAIEVVVLSTSLAISRDSLDSFAAIVRMLKRSTQPSSSAHGQSEPQAVRAPSNGPPAWAVAAVLAINIGAVYGWFLHVPFVFDDGSGIKDNPSIRSLWPLIGTAERPGSLNPPQQLPTAARPLVNLTFALNYHFWGLKPIAFHATNVVIHFLSALFVWALLRRTLRLPYFAGRFDGSSGWLALAVAMLWALHPLQTESVIYATQRTELMFAFFYLATFYCSLRYWSAVPLAFRARPGEGSSLNAIAANRSRTTRVVWLTLAVFASLAGMASKEVMVSAPLMVLLFERTFIAGSLAKALRQSWPLYVGLTATWLLLIVLMTGHPRSESAGFGLTVPAFAWWLTQAKVLLIYLKLVVWPAPLLIHYELPYFHTLAESWMYVVPVLLIAIATIVLLWRNQPMGLLATWIFAILSPTLIIPIVTETAAERRMYLPLLPLVAVFVIGGYQLLKAVLARVGQQQIAPVVRSPVALLALPILMLTIALGLLTASRLNAYNDEVKLWQDVLQVYPNDSYAQYNLGCALIDRNQLDAAAEALRTAIAHKPDDVDALNNLGVALLRLKRYEEGIPCLQHAVQLQPNKADARKNLGLLISRAGRPAEAIEHFKIALTLIPDDVHVLETLGLDFILTGRNAEAIAVLQRAAELQPDSTEIHDHLGSALVRTGKHALAIEQYRQALKIDPNDLEAHLNLGYLLAESGPEQEAVAHFEQAVRLKPDMPQMHYDFADLLRKVGRNQDAIHEYEAVIRLQPGNLLAYSNLAQVLDQANRSAEAIETAGRAIQAARATHQDAAAQEIETWLKNYRTGHERTNNVPKQAPSTSSQ